MRTSSSLMALTPAVCMFLLFAACGDVGDAPAAQTAEAVAVASAEGTTLVIDTSRSDIGWKAAKVTRAHDGGFRTFDGTVTVHGGEVAGVNIVIDTRSVWSDTERLTGHLKSEDFFEVETYPTATFEADQFVPVDSAGATHLVTGNLTMHGQTQAITFPAAITVEEGSVQASADFIIDRRDWGINYKGQADDLIENEVRLLLDVVAIPDQPVAGESSTSGSTTGATE